MSEPLPGDFGFENHQKKTSTIFDLEPVKTEVGVISYLFRIFATGVYLAFAVIFLGLTVSLLLLPSQSKKQVATYETSKAAVLGESTSKNDESSNFIRTLLKPFGYITLWLVQLPGDDNESLDPLSTTEFNDIFEYDSTGTKVLVKKELILKNKPISSGTSLSWSTITDAPAFLQTLNGVTADTEDNINLLEGDNITITEDESGNSLTISSSGSGTVTNNYTTTGGSISLSASTGISISGTNPSFSISNTDRGSSQKIFKKFKVGSSTASSDSNSDTFTFSAGAGISLGLNTSTDTLTITNTLGGSYLPLAGGTMAGDIDLDSNLLTNIGNAGTDFTVSGGLNLAGDLAVNSGSISTSAAAFIFTRSTDSVLYADGTDTVLSAANIPFISANATTTIIDAGGSSIFIADSTTTDINGGGFTAFSADAVTTLLSVAGNAIVYGTATSTQLGHDGTLFVTLDPTGLVTLNDNDGVSDDVNLVIGDANETGTIQIYSGGFAGTLAMASLGQASTISIPDPGGASDTVCLLTLANCAAGAPSFADITAGTNTSALVIGNGGTLSTSGTGAITATNLVTASSVVADAEVDDNITIDWSGIQNYPAACSAGAAVTTLADSPTCTAFTRAGSTETITGAWSFDNLSIADTAVIFSSGSSGFDLQGGGTTTLSVYNSTGGQIGGLSVEGVGAFGSYIATNSNAYLNFSGPDGDSFLYFYEGSSTTGESLSWDNTANEFDFTDDLSLIGGLTATTAIAANGGITFDAATDTIGAFTANGTIDMSTNILQNIGNTGTDFIAATGALNVAGALGANGGITFDAATDTIGAFTAAGTINMSTNILENIGNSGTDFIASTGALTLAGALTVNNNASVLGTGAADDDFLYFDTGTSESLSWDDSPGEFDLSDDLNITGGFTASVASTISSTANPGFTVGDGATGYLKIGATTISGTNPIVPILAIDSSILFSGQLCGSDSLLTPCIEFDETDDDVIINGALCVDDDTPSCPNVSAGGLQVDTAGGSADDPGDVFDLAEYYPAVENVYSGEIVSAAGDKSVKRSDVEYDQALIGVVSSRPAIAIDEGAFKVGINPESYDPRRPYVALAGRVPVKVSGENGSIAPGDPITSSSIAGVGMKATESGPIVGKALESFSGSGVGKVMVFVSTSWYVAPLGGEDDLLSQLGSLTDLDVVTLSATRVTADIIETKELVVGNETSGSEKITAGSQSVEIQTSKVKSKSKILVTFEDDYSPATRYWVKKKEGESFMIKLDQTTSSDASFSWLIVN